MSIILNIDCSAEHASVSLARDGQLVDERGNSDQKTHAGFLQPAILDLLEKNGLSMPQLDAISVTSGPGSYTGLRVGMASAKGLCYALGKPLVTVGTLDMMAAAVVDNMPEDEAARAVFCPMIDARRQEVFTALYNHRVEELLPPAAVVLQPGSFAKELLKNKVYFFGSGAQKWKDICSHGNAQFTVLPNISLALSRLGYRKFEKSAFADLAYCEPMYLKEFFTPGITHPAPQPR